MDNTANNRIALLDPHVADLIAAGEVVENPASVVKELIENALDAGAARITAEISGGGTGYIRVTDDGTGIPPADVRTAFLRHATSKIKTQADLEAIITNGFRGEALASVAAVARVDIFTKQRDNELGVRLSIEGGVFSEQAEAGCPDGTTIIVKDLFFNTPARQKFLKSARAESAACTSVIERAALSRPDVSFRFLRDGREELHTPGNGKLKTAIHCLFQNEVSSGLIEVSMEYEGVKISGYALAPERSRANRAMQYFFVNGRVVRGKLLYAAVEQAARDRVMTGKHPVCFLRLDLDPAGVDVNVHPAKTEVRFLNERAVFDAVYFALKGAYEGQTTRPTLVIPAPKQAQPVYAHEQTKPEQFIIEQPASPAASVPAPLQSVSGDMLLSSGVKEIYGAGQPVLQHAAVPDIPAQPVREEPPAQPDAPPYYRLVGEMMDMFMIIDLGDRALICDKHAAHERIVYERLKAAGEAAGSQALIQPVVIALTREEEVMLEENIELFERAGFDISAFGGSALVRGAPMCLDAGSVEAAVNEILANLGKGKGALAADLLDSTLYTVACHSSIRSGKSSSRAELEHLCDEFMRHNIHQCPHGRPVAVEITKRELERQIMRRK